jgi:protein-tyrosine-phosphatase
LEQRVVADLLTRVRRAPERLLHPLRRRQALAALRRRPRPARLLAVCHGNICRSPVVAALLGRDLAPLGIEVQSAGFTGPNRPPPREAVAAAARRGVDLSEHRSRLLTADLVRAVDLIVVMDPAQQRAVCERFGSWPRDVIVLGDLDPAPVQTRTIRDPVNQPSDVFDESYERIERCVRQLVRVLRGAGG